MAESSRSVVEPRERTSAADRPTCILVLGMAGSGKTSLVQRLTSHLHAKGTPPYLFNLDPAVNEVAYPANVDIRDTVKYREVMKQYKLGPNGAIMTALNLFSSRFDQAMHLIDKQRGQTPYVLLDTPGQMEVFTWSASGAVISQSLASTYPTVVAYVIDSARSTNPVTFMSNMLYACSILYRTNLPLVVVLNKSDIVKPTFAMKWMEDFDAFQESLQTECSYICDLTRSLSLALDEFYSSLKCVFTSAVTGEGISDFFASVSQAAQQYEREYRPHYERLLKEETEISDIKQGTDFSKLSLKQKAMMYSQSEIIAHERIHLGGAHVEDNEDDEARVSAHRPLNQEQSNYDSDDTEEDRQSFKRFVEETLAIKK